MRRLFIAVQFIILGFICIWVIYYVIRPVGKPDLNRDTWQSWAGFYAISYQGISKEEGPQYVSRKGLSDHLNALREAGFHTITPEDAAAFLAGRKPLPEKALLLIFEGGRKDSLIHATPPLRKNRFVAIMCTPTKLTSRWETFYLDKGDLKSLGREPNWRLCSMGHQAIDLVPTDASGAKGHFLTSPMWTGKEAETPDAFAARVNKDYAQSAAILEKASGKPVEAYLYPFADKGAKDGPQSPAATANLAALKQHHMMAFTRADNAFNSQGADPYDLNRIRVPAGWDAKKLMGELTKYAPRNKTPEGPINAVDWIVSDETKIDGGSISLAPDTVAWLRGTDGWENIDIKAALTLSDKATVFLYGRHAGAHSYLRLSFDKAGLRIQERRGTALQTIADYRAEIDTRGAHTLRLRIKGNRAWAFLDNKPVLGPAPLSAETMRGRVGLGSQDGMTVFSEPIFGQIPFYYVAGETFTGLPQSAQDEAGALLYPWFRQGRAPQINAGQVKDALIAASKGVAIIPVIEIEKNASADEASLFISKTMQCIAESLIKPLIKTIAVKGLDDKSLSLVRSKGYKIIRIVSPDEALNIAAKNASCEDALFIETGGKISQEILGRLLRVYPSNRFIVSTDETSAAATGVMIVRFSGR